MVVRVRAHRRRTKGGSTGVDEYARYKPDTPFVVAGKPVLNPEQPIVGGGLSKRKTKKLFDEAKKGNAILRLT